MDVELLRAGLPASERFFKRMLPESKVSETLLPIFFGKEDGCLVTRKGFNIMAELNPQISNQLKILAASSKYIPNLLAFNKKYQSKMKDVISERIESWVQTPAGRQILTIFQTEALVPKPFDTLGPTMELITEHQSLCGADIGTSPSKSGATAGKF